MARSTHAQEVATGTSDSYSEHELSDPTPPDAVRITRAMIGELKEREVKPSVGTDSSQSSGSESSLNESSTQSPPELVLTMENPSLQSPMVEDSTVSTTAGAGRKTGRQPSARPRAARSRTVDDVDFDDF